MYTKNFKNYMQNVYPESFPSANSWLGYIPVKSYFNESLYASPKGLNVNPGNANITFAQVTASSDVGFLIGSGTTPATDDDYCLENQIYGSSLASSASGITYGNDENGYYWLRTFTITNATASDITISEFGLLGRANAAPTRGANTNSSSYWKRVLLLRSLLESPIVIRSGDAGLVTFRIDFPFIT